MFYVESLVYIWFIFQIREKRISTSRRRYCDNNVHKTRCHGNRMLHFFTAAARWEIGFVPYHMKRLNRLLQKFK